MIVVSNTSPLTNLAAIGLFDLLHKLYDHVDIPVGVWEELNAYEKHWPGRKEVVTAEWISKRDVKNLDLVSALRADLDRGEAEAITLALELQADLVLLDEKEGRRMASRLGLQVTGVVGILIVAKEQGYLGQVRPWLDALRNLAGFYLSDAVYTMALRMSGEDQA